MTPRKKTSRGCKGPIATFIVLIALVLVVLWQIGSSRHVWNFSVTNLTTPSQTNSLPEKKTKTRGLTEETKPQSTAEKIPASGVKQSEEETPSPEKTVSSPELSPEEEPSVSEQNTKEATEESAPKSIQHIETVKPHVHKATVISGHRARLYVKGPSGKHEVALTFDAGASGVPTPKILSTLAEHHLHVTFFLTGKWVKQYPELAREIVQQGHEIGNHSYTHPRFVAITDSQIQRQLSETEDLIQDTTGRSTKPLFRPPFGAYNKHVLDAVGEDGYPVVIYWTLDSWDSVKAGITSKEISSRVLDKIQDGDIVLLHCGSMPTANALEDIIRGLESRGYSIVPVSELLGI